MTHEELAELIEQAAIAAGSQRKLAQLLETTGPTLIQMKQEKRPANWRVRGKLRVILGEDPTRAFVAAMAEDYGCRSIVTPLFRSVAKRGGVHAANSCRICHA